MTNNKLTDRQLEVWIDDANSVLNDGGATPDETSAASTILALCEALQERRKADNAEPVADVVVWSSPNEERICDIRWRRFDVAPGPLYSAPPAPVVPDEMYWQDAPVEGSTRAAAYATGCNACRAAMLHSFGNSEQLELVSDPHRLPSEMTPEMMRAVQLNSELGAYVAANLSGAYGLFAEFWKVACLAAGKSPAITDEARLISSTDCLRIGQPVTQDVRVANKVRAGGFGYLRVTQGDYGKLQVDFDRFIFDQGSAPETGKFIPKHMLQGIINRLQEHCDELTEEPLVNILDGLWERYKAPDGAKDPE